MPRPESIPSRPRPAITKPIERSAAISLERLQCGLQDIYELDIAHKVDDFLVTSNTLLSQLNTGNSNNNAREKLLVIEDDDGLNLSLYLDEKLLNHYIRHDPLDRLGQHNVQEFCQVLEGISHFLYLVWNATYDRSVTLLEMELQAEVDKYIMLLECMERQSVSPVPGQLSRLLFEGNVYHEDLSHEEHRRYRQATSYAMRYCRELEKRFLSGSREGLLSELRRFYRLTKQGKLDRICQSH